MVQNNSSSCDSYMYWSMFELNNVDIKLNPTIEMIKIIIVRVWSWKKINCSIKGDAAFWNPKEAHDGILKRKNSYTDFKSVALFCHIKS